MKLAIDEHLAEMNPAPRSPYYVVAPPYARTSAGIKAMHLLCHALNRVGARAYMCIRPIYKGHSPTNDQLLTPLLDARTAEEHLRLGLTPIAVYPETVPGNPLRAPVVARYVMNFPGLLGGTRSFDENELRYGYSAVLAETIGVPENVLFIPASDPAIFTPEPRITRRGSCFFAGKHSYVLGGSLSAATADSLEITRDQPDSPTPEQIAELFRRSELFYCYENSALAIEAVLCECPVVFIPNRYFWSLIASRELGMHGYAWGTDLAEVARAKATVAEGRANYLRSFERVMKQLERFVEQTQRKAALVPYRLPVDARRVNREPFVDFVARYARASVSVVRHQGWREFGRKAARKIVKTLTASQKRHPAVRR